MISNDNRKPTRTSSFLWKKPAKSILVWNARMDVLSRRKYRGNFVNEVSLLFVPSVNWEFVSTKIDRTKYHTMEWNWLLFVNLQQLKFEMMIEIAKRVSWNSLFSRTNFQCRVERILRLSFFRITINLLKHRFRPSKNTFKYLLTYEKRLLYTFYI